MKVAAQNHWAVFLLQFCELYWVQIKILNKYMVKLTLSIIK